jgi:4'-phosphopantetheinyl transferase
MEYIDPGDVHVWLCHYESIRDPILLKTYTELLSAEELLQQRRFYFERDRHRYLVTRALVRTVLSKYAPVAPRQWRFTNNSFGRPEVANTEEFAREVMFNLSHTQGLIALGVARGRTVGVDVENVSEQTADLEMAERFFAPAEVAALRALPTQEQNKRFFEYWTLKESYMKARGMGLSIPLDRFAFQIEDRTQIQLTIDSSLEDQPERWTFWRFSLQQTYLAAVCTARVDGVDGTMRRCQIVPLAQYWGMDGC